MAKMYYYRRCTIFMTPSCTGVFVERENYSVFIIGHIAAKIAQYLYPLLDYYRITW